MSEYLNLTRLAKMTGVCRRTVERNLTAMKRSGAYPQTTFLTNPNRIKVDAYLHYNTYQQLINEGIPFPEWRES